MISALKTDLKAGLKGKSQVEILKAIGYKTPSQKNVDRLHKVLASKSLGLDQGSYDLKYSTTELLLALSKVAGLDAAEARQHVEAMKQNLSDKAHSFKPYLLIDTDFDKYDRVQGRTLAIVARYRKVPLPKDTWRLVPEGQLQVAKRKAREHMAESGGVITFWAILCLIGFS